jgi:hypothetical protein
VLYGATLIAVVYLLPGGAAGLAGRLRRRLVCVVEPPPPGGRPAGETAQEAGTVSPAHGGGLPAAKAP